MNVKLFSLVMAVAIRQARNTGGRVWWLVLVVAWLLRRSERRTPKLQRFSVRERRNLQSRLAPKATK